MNFKQFAYYWFFESWLDCFIYNNRYILYLRRNKRSVSLVALLFTSPYILVNWILKAAYHYTIGKCLVKRQIEKEKRKKFKYEVAVVAISKNEGLYLKEWVEYYRIIGIDKIYFYDNESDDNTKILIKPYVDGGFVEYTLIRGTGKQLDAYNDAIAKHKDECRYMAFLDMDEYLMPENKGEKIGDIVKRLLSIKGNAAGVALNWCLYGNSGHVKRPEGLITESYVNRASDHNSMNHMIKTLCNPRLVYNYISPHYPQYKLGAITVDSTGTKRSKGWFCRDLTFKNLRLNHYWCKSEEDYKIKMSRGLGDRKGEYDMSKFHRMNFNEVYDDSMLVYKEELVKALIHEN